MNRLHFISHASDGSPCIERLHPLDAELARCEVCGDYDCAQEQKDGANRCEDCQSKIETEL